MTSPTEIIRIHAYARRDGIWSMKDSEVRDLYHLMEREGTVRYAFPDGLISCANDFLYMMKYGSNAMYLVYGLLPGEDTPPEYAQIAIIWLNNFIHRTAFLHFCAFKAGRKVDLAACGRATVESLLFQKEKNFGGYVLDMLYGVTPSSNRAALILAKKLGLQSIGLAPYGIYNQGSGKSEQAQISYITRDQFNQEG